MRREPVEDWEIGITYLLTIISIMFVIFLTFSFIRIDKQLLRANEKLDVMTQEYNDLVYENDILWNYVGNIDTCTSLEDAIRRREDVYDLIQFIDE